MLWSKMRRLVWIISLQCENIWWPVSKTEVVWDFDSLNHMLKIICFEMIAIFYIQYFALIAQLFASQGLYRNKSLNLVTDL